MSEIKFKDAPPIRSGENLVDHPAMQGVIKNILTEHSGAVEVLDIRCSFFETSEHEVTTVEEYAKKMESVFEKAEEVSLDELLRK